MAGIPSLEDSRDTPHASTTTGSDFKQEVVQPSSEVDEESKAEIPAPSANRDLDVTAKEAQAGGRGDEEVEYPHGLKLAVILAALCLAVFLVALDNTIISTAIPKITDHFNSITDIGWYGSAYLLTATALQPTFGRVYTIFSVGYCIELVTSDTN
jgi:hypothetical protein